MDYPLHVHWRIFQGFLFFFSFLALSFPHTQTQDFFDIHYLQLYDTSPMIPNWPWAWPCWNCTTSYKFSVSVKKMGEGWTRGASDIVKAESSGEDPRATGGLVSNLPHPRVNKTKQHWLSLFHTRTYTHRHTQTVTFARATRIEFERLLTIS